MSGLVLVVMRRDTVWPEWEALSPKPDTLDPVSRLNT
jgi:hypothetical protein